MEKKNRLYNITSSPLKDAQHYQSLWRCRSKKPYEALFLTPDCQNNFLKENNKIDKDVKKQESHWKGGSKLVNPQWKTVDIP